MTEVPVWFPPDVLGRLQGLADRERRTVPAQVLWTVERALDAADRAARGALQPPGAAERRGARAAFAVALREIHVTGGAPSTRALARKVGFISHNAVHCYLSGKLLPPWDKAAQIVTALGGDPESLRDLWVATQLSPAPAGQAAHLPAAAAAGYCGVATTRDGAAR